MKFGWACVVAGLAGGILAGDLETVARQFVALEAESAPTNASELAQGVRADGTWSDIDYADRNGTDWSLCNKHLGRTADLARAWHVRADAELAAAIHRSLGWWLTNRPLNGNWWYNDIGAPQLLALAAVCFKPAMDGDEMRGVIDVISRSRIGMSGQNRVWLARVCLMRALLAEDEALLAEASQALADEIAFRGVEGIQRDWSFHQHGNQPQFGNYGLSYIRDMSRLAAVFSGTRFAFAPEKIEMLNNLFAQGYAWTVWKGRLDVSCVPRQLRPDAMRQKGASVVAFARCLGRCGGESKRIADDFCAGRGPIGFKTFPTSAMSFYRQPGWMASHKGGTRTIIGSEAGMIQEDLNGQHLQDGMLCVSVTGREYEDVWPFWNWRKIPGITSYPDLPPVRRTPMAKTGPNALEDYHGERTAEGGGIVTFGVSRDALSYRQRIVFSPDGVFAETTDIVSTNRKARVATCVEAANAEPNAAILTQTENETRLVNGALEYVVYAPKASVEVFIGERTGDFRTFMRAMPSTVRTGRIFEVTVNHGLTPDHAKCAYRIRVAGP